MGLWDPRSSKEGPCKVGTQTSRKAHGPVAVGTPEGCGAADSESTAFCASDHCLRFLKPSPSGNSEIAVR